MSILKLLLTAEPLIEPVSMAELKAFLRVDYDDDDDLIEAMLKAVRKQCENFTGRALIEQTYSLFLDEIDKDHIQLPRQPLLEIIEVKLYDSDDNSLIYNPINYGVDLISGKLVLKNQVSAGREYNGIEISFKAGYGSNRDDVPSDLREGIKRSVSYLYENRGNDKDSSNYSKAIALWQDYRIVGL